MLCRLSICVLLLACVPARAADKQQIMASRYLRAQFCIERAIGQRWHERYGVPMVINRWGISEPTQAGLAQGPVALREAHARCWSENDIANEPVPQ
ncbi:Uncharacterised protein [Xylophilus ampelinus]|nr:hypothetical protein [Variovorax sp.]VTY37150.1 Uncharacterised protein [Xylophilus ampelinus]|tara:strand:- start:308 stop:595 length:288 start_codon:yes stop_codon:yes gene_type:complete